MDQKLFAKRRAEFMRRMGDGVAVFFAAPVRPRNHDVNYEYRQDSDFFYLTGFEEPESVCVLAPHFEKYRYVLFVRERDPEKETWTGRRAGTQGAMNRFAADHAFKIQELPDVLPGMMQSSNKLYFALNRNPAADGELFSLMERIRNMYRSGVYPPSEIIDPSEILSEMRLIKTSDDIELLQKAVDISTGGHIAAMKKAAPGKFEYEIQAELEYFFRSSGSRRNGYPCIVGSGPNSCILHYNENDRLMEDGDLLLVDAGAEYGYFTADITRTYPVNGKFSAAQKAVYEIVLEAQLKAIELAQPGNTFIEMHDAAVRILTEGMISLGLLKGAVEENIENKTYQSYYMHRTGHWLGMDVHDTGKYRQGESWRKLEAGMVTTVEPGLYIAEHAEKSEFKNIGVRIEDDILITPSGPRVLSAACPKEISELEGIQRLP